MMKHLDLNNQKKNGKMKSCGQKNNLCLQVNWIHAKYLMVG